jgi:hypothetical protein
MTAMNFADLVAGLRDFRASKLGGDPSDRALARSAGVTATTIGDWLRGERFPQDVERIVAVVAAIAELAGDRSVPAGELADPSRWRSAYEAEARRRQGFASDIAVRSQAERILAMSSSSQSPGRPLAEVTDPFALEVHRPVEAGDASGRQGLPPLPAYISRAHDEKLAVIVEAADSGQSGLAILVGGSSTAHRHLHDLIECRKRKAASMASVVVPAQ